MPATVILGGQWGDEGKAKVVDYLMGDHDVVVRYQGGANAGHTVVTDDGTFKFHQIPSGVLYPDTIAVMGNGMVIDPFAFLDEMQGLMQRGIVLDDRLFISSAAAVVMPFHRLLDNLSEADLLGESIGSTGKGIGPAYADKYARRGLRMGDFLLPKEELFELVTKKVEYANRVMKVFKAPDVSPHKTATDIINVRDLFAPFVADTQPLLHRFRAEGRRILLEGAQGCLLDIDHGTYPYVTSSSCSIGGAIAGTGLAPADIGRCVGIFKAYTTRVGNGPFPTELEDVAGARLRDRGKEFGTTTGRPRRCGWFDAVAGAYAVKVNGISEIALMKLDVLDGFDEVRVCTAYRTPDGTETRDFPQHAGILDRCEPVYETFPGWGEEAAKARTYDDLPAEARQYVEALEERIGARVVFISVGPDRSETILRAQAYSFDRSRAGT